MKDNHQAVPTSVGVMDRVHVVFVTFFIWYGASKLIMYLFKSMAETEAAKSSLGLALAVLLGGCAFNAVYVLLGKRDATIARVKTMFSAKG